jgi:hypothetical protein
MIIIQVFDSINYDRFYSTEKYLQKINGDIQVLLE